MLQVPLDSLPSSITERRAVLRDYFCDKDAQARRTENGWELTLQWPGGNERHVDPRLRQGLDWWGDGVELSSMAIAQRRSGKILTSLYDTWTLHSWSEWVARRGWSAVENVTILHVDDHRDLAPPRLFAEENVFRDALTGEAVELIKPGTVRDAILSGAIGMGSFLTPFLHVVSMAEVRHLCQPPKTTATTDYRIYPGIKPDNLLRPGAPRPAVELRLQPNTTGPGYYRITPDVNAWLDTMGNGPILLHIDMDYFNNRYDGDSDWPEHTGALNPPLETVLAKIDEVTNALLDSDAGPRIEDAVISYSPGFFPAEFWSAADARLRPRLEQLL
jgi:hypothetical protein